MSVCVWVCVLCVVFVCVDVNACVRICVSACAACAVCGRYVRVHGVRARRWCVGLGRGGGPGIRRLARAAWPHRRRLPRCQRAAASAAGGPSGGAPRRRDAASRGPSDRLGGPRRRAGAVCPRAGAPRVRGRGAAVVVLRLRRGPRRREPSTSSMTRASGSSASILALQAASARACHPPRRCCGLAVGLACA